MASDAEVIAVYERHLATELGRSPHTVRAYVGDVSALGAFLAASDDVAATAGSTAARGEDSGTFPQEPGQVGPDASGGDGLLTAGVGELRAWLGTMVRGGASRATVSRRAASIRTFYEWAHRTGLIARDPALRLVTARRGRHLPVVLSVEQAGTASTRWISIACLGWSSAA